MKDCLFVFSIDTEEEWDWQGAFPRKDISVRNVAEIPEFQQMLAQHQVKSTYFLDYAVLNNKDSLHTLKQVKKNHPDVEIGAHCHPWVTPPEVKIVHERDSHMVNLPNHTNLQQLHTLTSKITHEFGKPPTSFRSGRWGINDNILSMLIDLGYTVDSSMYPFYKTDWFDYRFDDSQTRIMTPNKQRPEQSIFELPISAGYNQRDFSKANAIFNALEQSPWKYTRMIGILWHLNVLRKIYLCPELAGLPDMKTLCDQLLINNYPVIHMYIHSSSLLPGSTNYVKDQADKDQLLQSIEGVILYLKERCNLTMCTISEAASRLHAPGQY